ncbi:DUF4136 domain-containing protein [Sphingomonas sp. DT-207]|uniref:DUF4136 domain-containing protein n=1 Tax=Sphingomonas sp. DT-207 TaxID=3396167 RepID=UPI003F196BD4
MNRKISLAIAAAALLAGGCAQSYRPSPVDVTRYHLGQPFERTTVTIEPMQGSGTPSPEYQMYADAVAAELAQLGYVRSTSNMPSGYIAGVAFIRAPKGMFRERPPVSIGVGGGSYSGGWSGGGGVGAGVSFGVGGKTRQVVSSELWVQLRRRSDNTVIWEGRALTDSVSGTSGSDPRDQAARLADALFQGFPGESGVTTTVK